MSKFYIIHLSDLHIIKPLTITMNNLISSITSNKELYNNDIVIVITGDIINQANYKSYKSTVISFFNKLKKSLDEKSIRVIDVIIVPGNHDKKVNVEQKICSILQHSHNDFPLDKNKQKENNKMHLPTELEMMEIQNNAFCAYLEICNEIFKIFQIRKKNKRIKTYNKTYGIDFCKIGDLNIIFIRLNTALTSYTAPNDSEKHHLLLGDFQKSQLLTDYKKLKESLDPSEESLTFCLAHHPSSYLESHESENLNKILISEEGLNADFFLSGHTHDGAVNNLSNHNRSMISLETGIGWPDNIEDSANVYHKNHRYAIYCFDDWKNTFYSIMYKTNPLNKFEFDTDYLITDDEKRTGKIYNPLKTRDYAFIPLNNYNNLEIQNLFIDRNNIKDLKLLFTTAKNFNVACNSLKPAYLSRYGDKLLINESTREKTMAFLNDKIDSVTFTEGQETLFELTDKMLVELINREDIFDEKLINEHFLAYLKHISDLFISHFKDYFDDDAEYRAVFRIYKKVESHKDVYLVGKELIENDYYEPICESPNETIPRSLEYGTVDNTSGKSRRYKYKNSLIEHSYNNKHSMIYSINPDKNYFRPDNWDDFMVIIPETNDISYYNEKRERVIRAPLCFIFSLRIKNNNDNKAVYNQKLKRVSNKLYLLQFTEIEDVLTTAIQSFLESFPIDLDKFIKYDFKEGEIKNEK